MMATTHALAGAALATVLFQFAPELAPVAIVAAFAGGLFPDLDLYWGHRRTLHFPVYYWIPATIASGAALLWPDPVTVGFAAFLVAAAVHSGMDAFGGGLELRPWEGTSDQAVYNHFRGHWIRPRRWVRYDGSPEDVLLGAMFAVPVLATVEGDLQLLILAAVFVSAVYGLVRKRIPWLSATFFRYTPAPLLAYVPERFLEE